MTGGLGMSEMTASHLLTGYSSPVVADLVPIARQNGWVAETQEAYVVAWNTKRVSPAERPRSWDDLANPRWKGKLAIADSNYDWYKTLREFWVKDGKTEAQADRLSEALAKNAVFIHGETLVSELLASGEYSVALSEVALIDGLHADGAPVAWKPAVEPVMPLPLGAGLVHGAKHPAAAVLFVDWLLGREGQRDLVSLRYGSVRKDIPFVAGLKQEPVDIPSLAAHDKLWSDRWDKLVKLGKAGPGS
jgi:iron(III) transport system substrate-binding protein